MDWTPSFRKESHSQQDAPVQFIYGSHDWCKGQHGIDLISVLPILVPVLFVFVL